jgi:hypothetical protein
VNTTCASAVSSIVAGLYYSDFRGVRRPVENANFGRNFRMGKEGRYNLFIRVEFVNIFNRTIMPNPVTTNPQNAPTRNGLGYLTGGFGVINAYVTPGTAPAAGTVPLVSRSGTLIARFSF